MRERESERDVRPRRGLRDINQFWNHNTFAIDLDFVEKKTEFELATVLERKIAHRLSPTWAKRNFLLTGKGRGEANMSRP